MAVNYITYTQRAISVLLIMQASLQKRFVFTFPCLVNGRFYEGDGPLLTKQAQLPIRVHGEDDATMEPVFKTIPC